MQIGDVLRPVLEQIGKLWARVDLSPVIRWGTVTQASPLRVQLDGDEDPLTITPQTALIGLRVGERVVCVEQHRRVLVAQVAGRNPPPFAESMGSVSTLASGNVTVTFPAGRFSVTPNLQISSTSGGVPIATSITSTSFAARLANSSGAQVAGTIDWRAAQMTATNAAG